MMKKFLLLLFAITTLIACKTDEPKSDVASSYSGNSSGSSTQTKAWNDFNYLIGAECKAPSYDGTYYSHPVLVGIKITDAGTYNRGLRIMGILIRTEDDCTIERSSSQYYNSMKLQTTKITVDGKKYYYLWAYVSTDESLNDWKTELWINNKSKTKTIPTLYYKTRIKDKSNYEVSSWTGTISVTYN